jgi:two-component system, chemotaxis family, sensor kinase Cph1
VASQIAPVPAFGQADLSNCEREQIHLAASVQPHGALLLVRESDCVIVQTSANAAEFLGRSGALLEQPLKSLDGDLYERVLPHLNETLHAIPRAVRCHAGKPHQQFDCLLHRPEGGGYILELEPAGAAADLSVHLDDALQRIMGASSLPALCDDTARILKDLTGYDRVMVYRFDDAGHGEVFAEQCEPGLERYLGNWYPASDIPQIARRLYERNRVRVLADVAYTPVPLTPRYSPISGRDLDMSLCFLRSMSPIHVQYLKNMGVAATLVVSLMVGGKLWGLISCHHYNSRFVHFEIRAVCELLAESIATRIAALESFVHAQAELSVRRLEQRLIESITRDGDWRLALFDGSRSLLQPVGATGAALLFEGQVLTAGDVPGTQELRDIAAWLDGNDRASLYATSSLSLDAPAFAPITSVASGVLAAPVSRLPGEYILWFRHERIRTVTWGGNPFKPVVVGDNPADLSPRRSFSQWHQLVEGTAEAWTAADRAAAQLIGDTVADVVLQFRAVRLLIAQDQLENVRRQLGVSEQPVIIADSDGHILLTNEACKGLLGSNPTSLQELDDLAAFFHDSAEVSARVGDLLSQRRTWRGEVSLRVASLCAQPLLVRADPVFSSPNRVSGFVLLFTDLTARKMAEAARRQFQSGIIEPQRLAPVRLDSKASLVFQNLLGSIVENAQLAALEITDGIDTARIPQMLESVRASVARTADVLELLIWHASRPPDDSP